MDMLEIVTRIDDGDWDSWEQYVEGYQTLIDNGTAWTLQGRIGREAARLIESGDCYPAGVTQ